MNREPAIYCGRVRHRRFRPNRHEFTYSVFHAWLDIDRIHETMAVTRWTAHNRFAWASFYDADYLSGTPRVSLRDQLTESARAEGIQLGNGPIFLLTNLRYLGYCFNPISLCYCYDSVGAGSPSHVLAEVTSTFGERRHYWLSGRNAAAGQKSLRFSRSKTMHVSPFMPMDLEYAFTLTAPGETLVTHINVADGQGPFFDATWDLKREEWSTASLGRQLVRHPWMTAKVMAAIHFEAARLWWKGVPVYTHPSRAAGTGEAAR